MASKKKVLKKPFFFVNLWTPAGIGMPGLFLIDLDYPAGYEALDAPDITVYNPIHRSRIETWKIVGVYFCRIFDYRRADSVDPNSALQFLRRRKNKAIDAAIDQRNGR